MKNMKITNSIPGVLLAGFLLIAATAGAQTPLYFGWSSVTPHTVDYDGDGKADPALCHDANGYTLIGPAGPFGPVTGNEK